MSDPPIDLKTGIVRDRHVTTKPGAIQVGTNGTDDGQITLSFGDDSEITYATLTPTEARAIATALEAAANQTATAETPPNNQ